MSRTNFVVSSLLPLKSGGVQIFHSIGFSISSSSESELSESEGSGSGGGNLG